MSFRVNFFPIPYILVLILLVAFTVVFNETIYSYFSASFEINGAIVGLFIFCNIWILGTLAYYSRNARLLSKIFLNVGPVVEKKSIQSNVDEKNKPLILQPSYTITGTLFDSPVFSAMLAKLDRKNKLEVSKSDADEIAQNILDNAQRILSPSKFIASIFILCGLIGTFFGLLETIGGVARALNTLATGGLTTDISKFIKLLSDPLQGMSTAFSASLFGLTSALVSNFGNHVAWQKVLLFTTKVRNYLLSNTGVFDEDPTRITVRDLLVSLEESFDLLYRGITNKLEDLTNHIATMGSVIVKTHERQERMLRVILKDHELMEQFWKRFLLSEEGIMGIIDGITERLALVLPESIRKVFAPVFENMLDIMDNNAMMLERALSVSQQSLGVQNEIADTSELTFKLLEEHANSLNAVNQGIMAIHEKLNLDEMASLIAEGNGIKHEIANLVNNSNGLLNESNALVKDNNEICIEANKLSDSIAGGIGYSNSITNELLKTLNASNAIGLDIKSIGQQNRELLEEGLRQQDINNNLSNRILESANQNNVVSSDTLLLLGNMLSENNDLNRSVLDVVTNVSLHNENMIRILDERFGMVIAFTSDLLSNATNTLGSVLALGETLMKCYDNQYIRLDAINHNLNDINTLVSTGLNIMDAGVNSSNAIIQRLDNNNELTISGLQTSNDILANVALANDTLSNIYTSTNTYFNDTNNFRNLYVGMGEQISSFFSSFLEFKDHFNGFLNTFTINTQTLNSLNAFSSGISERIGIVGSILNDVVTSLRDLNNITGDHKNLSGSVRDAIENLIIQSDALNRNVLSLGGVFDHGVGKVVSGISAINETSINYSHIMSNLLENIVSSLTTLTDVSAKASDIIDISNQSSNGIKQISQQLDDNAKLHKSQIEVSEEVKNILINTDNNIMGIGNVLNDIKNTEEQVNNNLSNIIAFNNSQAEHNAAVVKFNETITKSLDQVSHFVNNLGIVYEKYGDNVKIGLDKIIKGLDSIFNINNEMTKMINNINSLSSSIEQNIYGQENNALLIGLRDKMNDLISLKENMLSEFVSSVSPILKGFDNNFEVISTKLGELSNIAVENKDILSHIGSNTANQVISKFNEVNNSISGMDKNFKDLFKQFAAINKLVESHKDSLSNISDGLKDIKTLAKDFNSIPKSLNEAAAAIGAINNTISLLNNSSNKISTNLDVLSNSVSEEIKSLASIVEQLNVSLKSDLQHFEDNTNNLYSGINKLVSEISALGSELRANHNLEKLANENFIKEINTSFSMISNSINDVKSVISNIVGTQLVSELNKISGNQQQIAYKIDKISPYISDIVSFVSNLSSVTHMNNDLVKVVNALDKINDADLNNNAKLDILIKAADTLVAEMLNSRNVSQAILDIIAELGGFKRVK